MHSCYLWAPSYHNGYIDTGLIARVMIWIFKCICCHTNVLHTIEMNFWITKERQLYDMKDEELNNIYYHVPRTCITNLIGPSQSQFVVLRNNVKGNINPSLDHVYTLEILKAVASISLLSQPYEVGRERIIIFFYLVALCNMHMNICVIWNVAKSPESLWTVQIQQSLIWSLDSDIVSHIEIY